MSLERSWSSTSKLDFLLNLIFNIFIVNWCNQGKKNVHEHEPTSVFKGGDRSREQIEKSLSPSTSFGEGSSSSKVPLPDSDAETASTIQSQPSSPLSLSSSPSLNLRQLTLIENLERTSSYDSKLKKISFLKNMQK